MRSRLKIKCAAITAWRSLGEEVDDVRGRDNQKGWGPIEGDARGEGGPLSVVACVSSSGLFAFVASPFHADQLFSCTVSLSSFYDHRIHFRMESMVTVSCLSGISYGLSRGIARCSKVSGSWVITGTLLEIMTCEFSPVTLFTSSFSAD